MIVVGSVAAEFWGINRNPPKDLDIWLSSEEKESGDFSGREDLSVIPLEILTKIPTPDGVVSADALYTIKCSHLAWDIHWEKTKRDILYMEHKGCVLLPALYTALKKYWEGVHGDKSFLSLSKTKEDFFDDHVTYLYDHDYLHELVSHPHAPMYKSCLKGGEKVLTDKVKFDKLCFRDKVRLFREEITVIACERWLLNPKNKEGLCWILAYKAALKKTIISLTKGWASDFIIHNLKHFIRPDFTYFTNILYTLGDTDMKNEQIMEVFTELMEALNFEDNENLLLDLGTGDFASIFDTVEDLPWHERASKGREILDSFDYNHIQEEGGGAGGAEDCFGVFSLRGVMYKVHWTYCSYGGNDTYGISDSISIVQKKEKTITVYE